MKNLEIGMKVRIVGKWEGDPKDNPGHVPAIIIDGPGEFKSQSGRIYMWRVRPMTGYGIDQWICADSWELEPILKDPPKTSELDTYKVIDWSDCLWKPDHMKVH